MVGEGTLANERGEMRPFLGLKRGGVCLETKPPRVEHLGRVLLKWKEEWGAVREGLWPPLYGRRN